MKKRVKVVAAIIENENEQILCALRSKDMSLPCVWEFPGGKIEEGESPFDALKREIREELSCEILPETEIFDEYTHEYDQVIVQLISIKAKLLSGIPQALEHSALLWLAKPYLQSLVWAPADHSALDKITRSVL